jgi:hypothetical protein
MFRCVIISTNLEKSKRLKFRKVKTIKNLKRK